MESVRSRAAASRGTLSARSVRMLYGGEIWLSASRVDQFANCRFAYFCKYGLRAEPYETAGLKANEIGSFMHGIFEKTAADVMALGGFRNLEDEQILEIADKHIDDYFHSELRDFEEKSARFSYLFRRLRSDVHDILRDISAELRRSGFVPLDFELDINKAENVGKYEFSGTDRDLKLSGIIDRVDGWEHDGKLYIRVVDYKTGKKEFRLDDVYYGLDLQMLIYLNALCRSGAERYGKETLPAGVMYLPARNEIDSVNSGDAESARKPVKRSGFVIDDEDVVEAWENGEKQVFIPIKRGNPPFSKEQVSLLSRWVDRTIVSASKDIVKGDICAAPLFSGETKNACRYCDYKDQCGFIDGENGENIRIRRKMKTDEIWDLMKVEIEGEKSDA